MAHRQRGDGRSNEWRSSQVNASPHFFKIQLSAVPDQKLMIPLKFVSRYGKYLGNNVFLKVPRGAVWKVELEKSNANVWMSNGWEEFANHYSIGFGHLLVFRYNGNCDFSVIIFDKSASEIEYPVESGIHGEQTDMNDNGNSKIHVKEEVIEVHDSEEALRNVPCATDNAERKEIYGREELGVQSPRKTRQAPYYMDNIVKDVSAEFLDDPLLHDFPVSKRVRVNAMFDEMETNSGMHKFPPDIPSKGQKFLNQKKDVKAEIGTKENPGVTSIGGRQHQSQVPVKIPSTTPKMESRALERARDFKSKKPFFMSHMQPSYVSGNYNLNVPLNFGNKYLRKNQKTMSLQISDGTKWLVRCYVWDMWGKRSTKLGWKPFAQDNNLKVGDVCVFELIGGEIEPQLDVTIFRK